jgi:hypothetical protein
MAINAGRSRAFPWATFNDGTRESPALLPFLTPSAG